MLTFSRFVYRSVVELTQSQERESVLSRSFPTPGEHSDAHAELRESLNRTVNTPSQRAAPSPYQTKLRTGWTSMMASVGDELAQQKFPSFFNAGVRLRASSLRNADLEGCWVELKELSSAPVELPTKVPAGRPKR